MNNRTSAVQVYLQNSFQRSNPFQKELKTSCSLNFYPSMAFLEEKWQTARPTIRERSKFMFNNDLFSDVKFVVRKTEIEIERKQVIPAHKFVLSISSPVFEAMFYGELAETRDSIELPDCEYESLLELFQECSTSNFWKIVYLSPKQQTDICQVIFA